MENFTFIENPHDFVRGEVYMARLMPGSGFTEAKEEPVVILITDIGAVFTSTITVVPIRRTAFVKNGQLHHKLRMRPPVSLIKPALGRMICTFSPDKMDRIEAAVKESLGLSDDYFMIKEVDAP